MALRRLILLNVVDENFETAINASVIQVETESADLERLPSTFMLRIQLGRSGFAVYVTG